MEPLTIGWLGFLLIVLISTFGVPFLIVILISAIFSCLGAFSLLYLELGDIDKFYTKSAGNPLTNPKNEGGLKTLKELLSSPKKVSKFDSRVTGSELIDSSLQEILGYIIRDYVEPWFHFISLDTEFPQFSLKQSAQTFAINISNRIKEVDWIPYLTERLVDDAATHLRLFKQARSRLRLEERSRESRNSPGRDFKSSPKKNLHKRNKSETDATWYIGRNTEFKKDIAKTEEKAVSNSRFYTTAQKSTLEDHFFDLEFEMEKNIMCRDTVCTQLTYEKEFLTEIVEVLLYILLPDDDFQCKPLRFVIRDIFSNAVILPSFDLITDPDYINQAIFRICLRDTQIPAEIFLTTLRLTESQEELQSIKELVESEVHNLRSRDACGEDLPVKQQLSSLFYVIRLIDTRLGKLKNLHCSDSDNPLEYFPIENIRNVDLSLKQILNDNLGMSYFMDFVTLQGKQLDLFFYLNIEGWKNSVSKELADLKSSQTSTDNQVAVNEMIRSTALGIYEQYLAGKKEERVTIKDDLAQNLYFKIRNLNETPNECWFDKVKDALFEKMESECLTEFKKSKIYIKLLHELDLVPHLGIEEDSVSIESFEKIPAVSNSSQHNFLTVDPSPKMVKHARSFSDVTMFKNESGGSNFHQQTKLGQDNDGVEGDLEANGTDTVSLRTEDFQLVVNIIETGIVCERGKTFGIYAIRVSRQYSSGFLEEWHIYRRYSDFYDLHNKIKERYPDLSKISFPGKKTFHNMDRAVLERRMKMLGYYMGEVCQPFVINSHYGLRDLVMSFLEQGEYDRATAGPISTTINTLVNPIKSGMKSIKNMPEHLINTVDEVVGGLSKVFHSKSEKLAETSKVGASIEENDGNIPLRIMLLLMDEVFDLKCRNQWLRRRIVTILRQIVRTMFGDIVNRRILDYVSYITSPKNVASYLFMFKQSFWPNGVRNDQISDRCDSTKNRTRVAAKAALLSCLSDELKHIIGSETTRRGLLMVFDLFQNPVLNRRLLYVLLEGVLCNLFPDRDLPSLFIKLHSKSQRVASLNR